MSDARGEAFAWVARQSMRPLEPHEQAAFEAWLEAHPGHRGAYLRARAIECSLDKVTLDEKLRPSRESVRDGLEARALRHAQGRRRVLASGAALAGVAALAAGVLLPRLRPDAVLQTAKGEFRKVPLADRSTVSMNGASQVEVRLSAHARSITLARGEAWFEVAKDKTRPFVVEAGGVKVRAVGTAFAVRRRADGADVVVTEGVVEVWNAQGSARERLGAGDRAFVPERAAAIAVRRDPDEIERRLAWREGLLVFRAQSLSEAIAEFNRYNARTLVLRDPRLAGERVVGQYHIDQPERFADDVHTLLDVPVAVGAQIIEIGAKPAR